MLWWQCDATFRAAEPFRQLRKGAAPPVNLFVDYAGTPWIFLPFSTFRHSHWALCVLSIFSILVQLLDVAVSATTDISGYIFISSVRTSSSTTEPTIIRFTGTRLIRMFLLAASIYSILVLGLLSLELGRTLLVSTVSKKHWECSPLGVVLGWLVKYEVLVSMEKTQREEGELSLSRFNKHTEGQKWKLGPQNGDPEKAYTICKSNIRRY
ncbi:hypothetical protein CC86DRAFT_374792 [Ophiobolus disseminans]|uniref:Uncharacterized protein n=1 Tax=Ophiobolus disseminans TaxID=1469910 RepID=A0A6A6ZG66_9PLEO|nr:hypothetical protein CC86DRAFT_374792 [Ophiobolus disseminans]